MPARLVALTAVAAVSLAGQALAQTDPYAMAHAAAANQLGVMEYCQGRGDVGADAVAAQRSAIARLPASTTSNDADEALGKQGTLSAPNGAHMTLDSVASSRGTSVSAVCKQMGSSAVQTSAMFQQNGVPPGGTPMPALPNGVTMPALPNGVTMPAMPNGTTMPAIPAAPPQ